MSNKCEAWCTPLILYIIISAVGLLGMLFSTSQQNKTSTILTSLAWSAFWSYVMYWLCQSCNQGWAWALFLVPMVLWIFMAAFIMGMLSTQIKGCVTHPDGGCECDTMLAKDCKGEVVNSCQGYCT